MNTCASGVRTVYSPSRRQFTMLRAHTYIVAAKNSDHFAVAVKLHEQPLFHILKHQAQLASVLSHITRSESLPSSTPVALEAF